MESTPSYELHRTELDRLYYKEHFTGQQALYNASRLLMPNPPTYRQIKEYVNDQFTTQVHKQPPRVSFVTMASGVGEWAQADLLDVRLYNPHDNKGVKYLLTFIDIYSRYAKVVGMKQKTDVESKIAWETILSDEDYLGIGPIIPKKLVTDQGKEFENKLVQDYMKKKGVDLIAVPPEDHPGGATAVVERFNRTIRDKIVKFLTSHKGDTRNYIDSLPELVASYNKSVNRGINAEPLKVVLGEKVPELSSDKGKNLDSAMAHQMRFEVGDRVRLLMNRKQFDKGTAPKYTVKQYTIEKINKDHTAWRYQLKGDSRVFKSYELQLIKRSSIAPSLQELEREAIAEEEESEKPVEPQPVEPMIPLTRAQRRLVEQFEKT